MPARRELTMRQLRQMLRLARDGVSAREIGRTLGVARSTVQDNLKRAEAAGLRWPLPAEITDPVLEQRLFAPAGVRPGLRNRVALTTAYAAGLRVGEVARLKVGAIALSAALLLVGVTILA